jgi:hypothetical protein
MEFLTGTAGSEGVQAKSGSCALSWAALMHRAFSIDVLACPQCRGRLRLIATLHDPAVIRNFLAHLGMAPSGPSPGPAHPSLAALPPDPILDGGGGGPRVSAATRHSC